MAAKPDKHIAYKPKKEKIKAFDVINVIIMALCALVVLIPLFSVVSTSLVTNQELISRKFIIFPSKISFQAYATAFAGGGMLIRAYGITIFRVVVGTAYSMIFTYFVGYALAKKDLPGQSAIAFFFFFTMLFGGGMIPTYITIKYVGLMNNIWVYILPNVISVWNVMIMRTMITSTIPDSLFESAEIDGANDAHLIFRIVLPLTIPALATLGLFYAVGQWNSWWDAFLYIRDQRLFPVQLLLRNILINASATMQQIISSGGAIAKAPAKSVQNAVVVISTLPIVCIYPFLQKYFIKGVMIGAIKG